MSATQITTVRQMIAVIFIFSFMVIPQIMLWERGVPLSGFQRFQSHMAAEPQTSPMVNGRTAFATRKTIRIRRIATPDQIAIF
jgi:hypothetical protein